MMVYRVWSSDGKRVVEVIRETVRPSVLFDGDSSAANSADEGTADALSPTRSEAVPTNPREAA